MNRLQYILSAKTQYDIQSPFMYDLYENVLAARLDGATLARTGIGRSDRYGQLRYKLADHYRATHVGDDVFETADGSRITMVRRPHRSRDAEEAWERLFKEPDVTLSVDLFDAGLAFTSPKLSKQHIVFRVF